MSPQGPSPRGQTPRYELPVDREDLKNDLSIRKVMDMISQILANPNRPLMWLPSTEDVVRLIAESIDLAIQCLREDHWAEASVNPEVIAGETETGVESYAISIDPATGLPAHHSDDPGGIPVIQTKPMTNQGTVSSRTVRAHRTRQSGKEPLPFYRFLLGIRNWLAAIPHGIVQGRLASELGRFADGLESYEVLGTPQSGKPRLASRTPPTLAYWARQAQLEKGKQRGGPQVNSRKPKGKGTKK